MRFQDSVSCCNYDNVKLYGAIRGMCHEIKILQLFEQGTNVTRYRTDQTRGVYMRLFVYVQQILGIFRQAIHKKLIWSCNWCLFVMRVGPCLWTHILVLGFCFISFCWQCWLNSIKYKSKDVKSRNLTQFQKNSEYFTDSQIFISAIPTENRNTRHRHQVAPGPMSGPLHNIQYYNLHHRSLQ